MQLQYLDLAIAIFSKSNFYDTTDSNFHQIIEPYLADFTSDQLKDIVSSVHENSQINGRGMARYTNRLILAEIENKIPDFDYSKMYNFKT